MLIEDNETMVSLLRTLLELEGFKVAIPPAGEIDNYASIISDEQPDILLLDVHLRHLNGVNILRQIRGHPSLKNLKILMSSGIDLKSECLSEGADGFLLKPYLPDDLVALIRHQISG